MEGQNAQVQALKPDWQINSFNKKNLIRKKNKPLATFNKNAKNNSLLSGKITVNTVLY